MNWRNAYAKINLGLVVGPARSDGKHEVLTLMQTVDLHDRVGVTPAAETAVDGFAEDTIVAAALGELRRVAEVDVGWHVRIEKRIPVAAGLGGGSSDAAAALTSANATLERPLGRADLHALAARIGADVPFFLLGGSCLASGDGSDLRPIAIPRDYSAVLVLPSGIAKESTAAVYDAFDRRSGATGFDERAAELSRAVASIETAGDLSRFPPNDLASSPLADDLLELGAFRADVSGAGPAVYGLFADAEAAARAEQALRPRGRTYVTQPV
jgi:4-diphosphocytidyl-2-C-methyl-D-erythritol kinase